MTAHSSSSDSRIRRAIDFRLRSSTHPAHPGVVGAALLLDSGGFTELKHHGRWRSVCFVARYNGSSRDKDKQRTFILEALATEQDFEETALGDRIVFTTQLLKGDTEVGHRGGYHGRVGQVQGRGR